MATLTPKFVRVPPGTDQQCTAIISSRMNPERVGHQCQNWKMPGDDEFCAVHGGIKNRRCKGTYSKGHEKAGQQCVQIAMKGQNVCEKHGGLQNKPKILAAEEEAKFQTRMVKILERHGADVSKIDMNNPLEVLKNLATELFEHKEAMKAYVDKLEGEIRYESKAGGEQLRAEMALYERAMDRCITLLAAVAKLNIDERLAKIEEAKIVIILNAIDTGINRASLPSDKAVVVRKEIAAALRASTA